MQNPTTELAAVALSSSVVVYLFELFVPGSVLPFFGVSITTLGMAAAGSLAAFAYAKPLDSKRQVYGFAIGGTLLGVWMVQILPAWLGWTWYIPSLQPPVAGVIAFVSRWGVPIVTKQLPNLWQRIFNTGTPPSSGD